MATTTTGDMDMAAREAREARGTRGIEQRGAPRGRLTARVGSARWALTLSALTAITALSIDMSLPAQPTLARVFGVSSDQAGLTLTLFLLGYSGGQLAAGYASDALGRRRVLLGGLAVFVLAGVACGFSNSLGVLLACRFVQGLGAATGPVIGRAMVRDTQTPGDAARLLSAMMAVLAIAPMVAPLLGAAFLGQWGWRSIFAALVACGVILASLSALTLPETLPAERRVPSSFRAIPAGFARFFRAPGTTLPTLLVCATFAGQFAYVSGSAFVLIDGYGVAPGSYGLYFAVTALALMAGAAASARLLRRDRPPRRVLRIGAGVLCAGVLLLAAGVHVPALGVVGFMAPMVVCFVGFGLLGPNATAIAMEPVPEIAGTASASIGFLQMVSGALSGYLATRLAGSDPRALGLVIASMGLLGAGLAVLSSRTPARAPAVSGSAPRA